MPNDLAQFASEQDWERLEQELRTRHASVEELTTTLRTAVYHQNLHITALLLEAGADPNRCFDGTEVQAMATAVEQEWQGGLTLLINHGGDVNVREHGGWTPLIHAVDIAFDGANQAGESPSLELLSFLLDHGADPKLRDAQGRSAADLAETYGWTEAVNLLTVSY